MAISRNGHWAAFDTAATDLGGDPTHHNVFRAGRIPCGEVGPGRPSGPLAGC